MYKLIEHNTLPLFARVFMIVFTFLYHILYDALNSILPSSHLNDSYILSSVTLHMLFPPPRIHFHLANLYIFYRSLYRHCLIQKDLSKVPRLGWVSLLYASL